MADFYFAPCWTPFRTVSLRGAGTAWIDETLEV